jgi:hypothetical protein
VLPSFDSLRLRRFEAIDALDMSMVKGFRDEAKDWGESEVRGQK